MPPGGGSEEENSPIDEAKASHEVQGKIKTSQALWYQITGRDPMGNKLDEFDIKYALHPQYLSKLPSDLFKAGLNRIFNDKYTFSDQDGTKLTIQRQKDGFLLFQAQTHEKRAGINAVELLMANVKRVTDLMLEERLKAELGDTQGLSEPELKKKKAEAIAKLEKESPDFFHFEIGKSASASDIAYMLSTMESASPKMTATLTAGALKQVKNALDMPHYYKISEKDVGILQKQLIEQNTRAADKVKPG